MKQTLLVILSMVYLSWRGLSEPFWAIFLYYSLAILRPQAIWEWALPAGWRWSLVAAGMAMVAVLINGARRAIVRPRFIVLLVLLGLFLFGSYTVAQHREVAATVGWEYAKIIIMLLLSCAVIGERRHLRYLGLMIWACLTYLVYEVNSLYLFSGRLDVYHFGYGGLDNNGAGLMLAMVLPFCYQFFLAERRWWRWGYLLTTVPAMHAVMLTYSRGAMLSGIIGGAGMLLSSRRHRMRTLLAGGLLILAATALSGQEVRARFFSIERHDSDASAQSRLDSWRAGLDIAKDYPLFGCGLRNSNFITQRYGADREGRTIHNLYIQIAADSGFPAAILYISLLAMSLAWLWQSARLTRDETGDEMRWHYHLSLACAWSLVIFGVGSLFLSTEIFECSYLQMLIAAAAPGLAIREAEPPLDAAAGGLDAAAGRTLSGTRTGGML